LRVLFVVLQFEINVERKKKEKRRSGEKNEEAE
jgi:hypothetical protein